jgi:hypothetical protein
MKHILDRNQNGNRESFILLKKADGVLHVKGLLESNVPAGTALDGKLLEHELSAKARQRFLPAHNHHRHKGASGQAGRREVTG